jgi:light-regulated signal transduction histidine kinase (bacteriophytochrome)
MRSNWELDAFASIASHDLREPLRGMRTYAQILLEDHGPALGQDGADLCRSIIGLAARLDQLIDSLRRYDRVGRGGIGREQVDLRSAALEAQALLQIALDEARVALHIQDDLPTLACDRTLVIELLENLIQNGIKYNDKTEKAITVGATRAAGLPAVFVRDNGIGVDPAHHESIFQMFKRLHPRNSYGGGSGAGLTIARKIVERHGGRIWIDSVVGEGTTVYFTLEPEVGASRAAPETTAS